MTVVALTGHTNRVDSLELSADGQRVLTRSGDQTTKLWAASGGPPTGGGPVAGSCSIGFSVTDLDRTVAAVGEGLTAFKVGDAVFGVLPPGQEGTYAEKVSVKAAAAALSAT